MNKGGLLYLTHNKVPPTLLLRKKMSVLCIYPFQIPRTNVVESNPTKMPFGFVDLEKELERSLIAREQVVMERARDGYVGFHITGCQSSEASLPTPRAYPSGLGSHTPTCLPLVLPMSQPPGVYSYTDVDPAGCFRIDSMSCSLR